MPEAVVLEQQPQSAPPPATPPAESQPAQEPAESAPATPPEGEQPAASEKTDGQPEKSGESRFQRRLNKVYRKFGEEKARADFLQKQLDDFKSQQAPASAAQDGSPRIEQFDDIEKWRAAVEKHASERAIRDYEAKQRVTAQQQSTQRLSTEWEEKVAKASDKYEDFDDVVGDIKPVNAITQAIMSEDNGPDVAYYLGKHLKEAQRIGSLSPIQQITAIGRLAERLSAKPPEARAPSNAPKPITPITGKAASTSEAISPEDEFETFLRKRNKQLGRVHK